MGPEKIFERNVVAWLRGRGCYVVKYYGSGSTRSGVPDLLVCVNGMFVSVELKAEKGVVSQVQKAHMNMIERAGGIALTLRPSEFKIFKEFINGRLREGGQYV